MSGQGYRWYLAAQVVSLAGTMMNYTALFWLVLHLRYGGPAAAVMPAPWAYDATMVVVGAATQLFAASAIVYMQQATPAAQRAHALSAFNAAFIGFVPAGAFAVAAIASLAGTRWALAGPALAVAACAAVLTYRTSRPARLAEHPAA